MANFSDYVKTLLTKPNVRHLTRDQMDEETSQYGRVTRTGGHAYSSNVRNRSAGIAVTFGSDEVATKNLNAQQLGIADNLENTLDALSKYLDRAPLVSVTRTIGDNDDFNAKCTLLLSEQRKDNLRQGHLWTHTLREYSSESPGPDLYLVSVPEWPENDKQVLCFPDEGLTIVLGIDYVGEVKMGFLRMAMWEAKKAGMLRLHAGSKLLTAKQPDGSTGNYGMLLFGLSGTGKTTHSCHDHGLTGDGEGINILQDDIVFLGKDGSAKGTERGFFLKTEGLEADTQPLICNALDAPEALFENVMVTHDGEVDYNDLSLGGNGRAVISRSKFAPHIGESIDLPSLDDVDGLIVAFITRRMTVLPFISKLTPEQAAATFMLGESVETSAGDPTRAGESVRVVGTNPFLLGSPSDEGNWFYDFVSSNQDKVHCYLLNTGGVGEIFHRDDNGKIVVDQPVTRVAIDDMAKMIQGIARNNIEWVEDGLFGGMIPSKVEGVDLNKYDLSNFYSQEQIKEISDKLTAERKDHLKSFVGLNPNIVTALD